jgi:hypothetical protein
MKNLHHWRCRRHIVGFVFGLLLYAAIPPTQAGDLNRYGYSLTFVGPTDTFDVSVSASDSK